MPGGEDLMGGVFEALLAMIGFGVLVAVAWAVLVESDDGPTGELRQVRRTAEAEMRRAAEHLRGGQR